MATGLPNYLQTHGDNGSDARRRARLKKASSELNADPVGIKKAQQEDIDRSKELNRRMKAKSTNSAPKSSSSDSVGAVEDAPRAAKSGGVDASAVGKAGAQGGNTMDMLGNMGMASGNPYAMAAGAALKVVGNVQKKREARAQQAADLENRRRERLQEMLSGLGSGVGTLGMA